MTRPASFLLLTAALVAALGYWALHGPEAQGSRQELVPMSPEGLAELPPANAEREVNASTEQPTALVQVAAGDSVREWEVIPMNQRGQPIADATVTARMGAETLKGVGRTTWSQVPPGTWELTVQARGEPNWSSQVTLETRRQRQRTAARVGRGFQVKGTIVDTNGSPVARTRVFLLPPGAHHPSEDSLTTQGSTRARGPHVLLNGVVASATSTQGSFQFNVQDTGQYRLSVGAGGSARWTQRKGVELRNGGPTYGQVTIPARAHLTLSFTGAPSERPSSVKVYGYDADLASKLEAEEQLRIQAEQEKESQRLEKERAAKEKAKAKMAKEEAKARAAGKGIQSGGNKAGSARAQQRAASRRRSRRSPSTTAAPGGTGAANGQGQPIFGPGWRILHAYPVKGETLVLSDLPSEAALQFLFLRGPEQHGTSASRMLPKGRRSLGTVTLPPLPVAKVATPTTAATIAVSTAEREDAPAPLAGVIWGQTPQ